MRRRILGLAGTALGLALGLSAPASADVVTLPLGTSTCGTAVGTNCLVFDNFNVYSLALLNYQAGAGDVNGNDPYAVSTNGTALRNAVVVGTGPGGAVVNTDVLPFGTVDNAYGTPTAGTGNLTNFATKQGVPNVLNSTPPDQGPPDPGGLIPGNTTNTWDVSTTALKTYLNGGSLVFFFNLNQTGSNQTSYLNSPEDALGWMSVTLKDSADPTQNKTFWLDGNACNGPNPGDAGFPGTGPGIGGECGSQQAYIPNSLSGDNNNSNILTDQPSGGAGVGHNEFAYIHGQICVGKSGTPLSGAVLGFGACTGANKSLGDTVNQNLGAGLAAFALYSQALQDALANPIYDDLSVDFRMAALDNGYEQLLIFSSNAIPRELPEPLTITIFGAGLAGLGLMRRRRKV